MGIFMSKAAITERRAGLNTVLSKQKAWRGSIHSEEVGLSKTIYIIIRVQAQERLHSILLSHPWPERSVVWDSDLEHVVGRPKA